MKSEGLRQWYTTDEPRSWEIVHEVNKRDLIYIYIYRETEREREREWLWGNCTNIKCAVGAGDWFSIESLTCLGGIGSAVEVIKRLGPATGTFYKPSISQIYTLCL